MIRRFSGCSFLPVLLLKLSYAGDQALDACFSRASAEWTVGSVLRPTSSGEGLIVTGIVASVAGWNPYKFNFVLGTAQSVIDTANEKEPVEGSRWA